MATALVTAGFLLAPAAHAASHPVQVTGHKLKSGLLPASAFGSDYQPGFWADSGKSLWHGPARDHVSTMSCGNFEGYLFIGAFGESGSALSFDNNPNPFPDYPNTEFYYVQAVYQFPTVKAANTYYSQAHAKYVKCTDFTQSIPASSVPGSGKLETTTQSVSKTKVGRYQAFQVGQSSSPSDFPGISFLMNTMVTVEGTDVFTMISVGGTNDPVPTSLMLKLINRIKKLH